MIENDYSLSVIIPNYNKAAYLERCINSVLDQEYLPSEIIIVDDCSTDDSVDVIERFCKKNPLVKLLLLDANGGVSNARNKGAEVASSSYITFLDSDDFYFNKNKLRNEIELIKSIREKDGSNAIAYSAILRVDIQDKVYETPSFNSTWYINGRAYYSFLSKRKSQTIPRDYCVLKDSFFKAGGYSYPKNFYEDLDLLIRLSKIDSFYYTGEAGTAYRITPNGLSKRPKEEHVHAVNTIIAQYKSQEPIWVKVILKLMGVEWKFESRLLLYREQRKKFYLRCSD